MSPDMEVMVATLWQSQLHYSTWTYNSLNEPLTITIINPDGVTTTYIYNADNRLLYCRRRARDHGNPKWCRRCLRTRRDASVFWALLAVTFKIFKGFPPDSEGPIAELNVNHDGVVDIPAEIRHERGELRIAIFGRKDGFALDYPLDEFLEAIRKAVEILVDQ